MVYDLARADVVVATVDADSQESFRRINRPAARVRLSDILEGIKRFRDEFSGEPYVE